MSRVSMRLLSRKWNSLVILFVFSEVDWMYTLEQGRAKPWSKPVDQLMKASKVQPQLPPELPDCEGSWARQLGRQQLQLRLQPDPGGSCQLRCSRRVGVKSSSPRWVTPTDSPCRHSSNWKMFRQLWRLVLVELIIQYSINQQTRNQVFPNIC